MALEDREPHPDDTKVFGSLRAETIPVEPERCPHCGRFMPLDAEMTATLRQRIGANVRRARLRAGMTQDQVAANCDPPVSRVVLTRIEAGSQVVDVGRLMQVAAIVGVDWRDVLTVEESV